MRELHLVLLMGAENPGVESRPSPCVGPWYPWTGLERDTQLVLTSHLPELPGDPLLSRRETESQALVAIQLWPRALESGMWGGGCGQYFQTGTGTAVEYGVSCLLQLWPLPVSFPPEGPCRDRLDTQTLTHTLHTDSHTDTTRAPPHTPPHRHMHTQTHPEQGLPKTTVPGPCPSHSCTL